MDRLVPWHKKLRCSGRKTSWEPRLIYLEADNVSCVQCVWSDGGKYYVAHPYLFLRNGSAAHRARQHAAVAAAATVRPPLAASYIVTLV